MSWFMEFGSSGLLVAATGSAIGDALLRYQCMKEPARAAGLMQEALTRLYLMGRMWSRPMAGSDGGRGCRASRSSSAECVSGAYGIVDLGRIG
ncbi:hypothetical protein [Nonomuraea sp. NPDC048826]|uniref:hypothetical protein n=1 Tax=Nonomuraea sp. NPDC048826 TaxID=3364347 RepID=UPI003711B732